MTTQDTIELGEKLDTAICDATLSLRGDDETDLSHVTAGMAGNVNFIQIDEEYIWDDETSSSRDGPPTVRTLTTEWARRLRSRLAVAEEILAKYPPDDPVRE